MFKKADIPEIILIEPKVFSDDRGVFFETYKKSEFKENGIKTDFVQINQSVSSKNVLRGLHYQINPKAQDKLVRVIKGLAFDVAIDIRRGSPTYGMNVGIELSDSNQKMIFIPKGFAHGFLSKKDNTILEYLVTNEYSPSHEASINWNDPDLSIDWGIGNPYLSKKDQNAPYLSEAVNNFKYLP